MKKLLLLLIALLTAVQPLALAHTRQEVRQAWADIGKGREASPYSELPVPRAPYAAGALDEAATADALAYLNFARWLAGVGPVDESALVLQQSEVDEVRWFDLQEVQKGLQNGDARFCVPPQGLNVLADYLGKQKGEWV